MGTSFHSPHHQGCTPQSCAISFCVKGIERFIARRGTPSAIWLVNGKNFVGAEKKLLACIKNCNGMASSNFAHKGVPWKINPIKAVLRVPLPKRILYDILGSRRVIYEVIRTTFCLFEQASNSMPITPVSTDSRDLESLTPNHFLLGQYATSFPSLLPEAHFHHKKGTCERSRMLMLFGLAGLANLFPHWISVSSGTLCLTSRLWRAIMYGWLSPIVRVGTNLSPGSFFLQGRRMLQRKCN